LHTNTLRSISNLSVTRFDSSGCAGGHSGM
jgi:hypothetical protein